ncbi:hypothetical protein [Nocardia camponoti]|uniref:hypothetical protein n=1 Tax=Nocardia camponoti TaxID=1616106 RepID=UPI0016631992|nr:hypothetical protein [Nocardia camponoti]
MRQAARLRGVGSGALTGALAVAAHGWVGGAVGSAQVALLLLVCVAVGVSAGADGGIFVQVRGDKARNRGFGFERARKCHANVRIFGALLGGQFAGHVALSVGDHHPTHLPTATMFAAHVLAAFACAALLFSAERLYLLASSVVRAVVGPPPVFAAHAPRWVERESLVPTQLFLRSRAPRGPPAMA